MIINLGVTFDIAEYDAHFNYNYDYEKKYSNKKFQKLICLKTRFFYGKNEVTCKKELKT